MKTHNSSLPGQPRIKAVHRAPASIKGFSMIEMIIVIVLVGVIFGIGGMLLNEVFRAYFIEQDVSSADSQARVALERAARELRAVRTATTNDLEITAAVQSQFRFVDTDGNGICFFRDAAANQINRNAVASTVSVGGVTCSGGQMLAENIDSLTFSFWTNTVASTATAASVYYIAMSISVTKNDYSGSFRTNIRPRNF